MKRSLAWASALVCVGAGAQAGDIDVPGRLDLTISGESKFDIEYADSDFRFGRSGRDVADGGPADGADGREFFFNQDHEIRFRATGVGDTTGIEYGVNLELELQTGGDSNGTDANWDEAWTYIKGGWGEVRLGNEDSPAETLSITAAKVAAGTEGVDGDLRITPEFVIADGEEATKIIYFLPEIDGFEAFRAATSFAINEGDSGSTPGDTTDAEDILSFSAQYLHDDPTAAFEYGLSGAVVVAGNGPDGGATNWSVGALIRAFGVGVAGYYGQEESGFSRDGLNGESRDSLFNVGVGGEVAGNVALSLNYQYDDFDGGSSKSSIIAGVTVPLLPGVSLNSDIGYQDQDISGADDVSGFNALGQLRVAF